jgi:hypothetical protein
VWSGAVRAQASIAQVGCAGQKRPRSGVLRMMPLPGLSLLLVYSGHRLLCVRPLCIAQRPTCIRSELGPAHQCTALEVGYPPPQGPSPGSELFRAGPSSLIQRLRSAGLVPSTSPRRANGIALSSIMPN